MTTPVIGGYEIVRPIGRGAHGVVFEAVDQRLDRRVAIKVLKDAAQSEDGVRRLWAEARLAASVSDPGVVAVHDFGYTVEGAPFYAMELVEGTDLGAMLREGALPQKRALTLALEIARAVATAHDRGVVHCDLRPAKVLVDAVGRARILDFGVAFDGIHGESSASDTSTAKPQYLAPEQVEGDAPSPATDVHAIGLLLFEMLTGVSPYARPTRQETLAAVTEAEPAKPSSHDPTIGPELDEVVQRCLRKNPGDRIRTAWKLVSELEVALEGRPSMTPGAPPEEPPREPAERPAAHDTDRDEAPLHFKWSWTLTASPEVLWPFVADTERLNKAIALQPVTFTDEVDASGQAVRRGKFHVLGMDVEWREFPFEWIWNREHSVHRHYMRGPLEALWNRVQLAPHPQGGTELVHEIWIRHRGLLGRMAVFMEVSRKTRNNLDEVYRRLDAYVSKRENLSDPFEAPHRPSDEQRAHVTMAQERLVREHGGDARLCAQLSEALLHWPTKTLERMRPYALASTWTTSRDAMLDLFLDAASVGLLDLAWDSLCPKCMAPHETSAELAELGHEGKCGTCRTTYARDLSESVELVFKPHARVRQVRPTTYCIGAPARRPHVLAQQIVAARSSRELTMKLPRGDYRLTSDAPETIAFGATPLGYVSHCRVTLREGSLEASPPVVRVGEVAFQLHNETGRDQVFRLEIHGAREDAVTAAVAMTHPTFQEQFANQLLAADEPIQASRMAFLLVDLPDRARLYEQGDAGAYQAMRELSRIVRDHARVQRGAVVSDDLGHVVVAFGSSMSALRAAIALQEQLGQSELESSARAAIHEGSCLAITRDGRTLYFGKTLHRLSLLVEDAPRGGVALSLSVSVDRWVTQLLQQTSHRKEVTTSAAGAYSGMRITRVHVASED